MAVEHLQNGIAFDLLETGDAHREYPVHEEALPSGYRMSTNYGVFRAWVGLACVVDAVSSPVVALPCVDRGQTGKHLLDRGGKRLIGQVHVGKQRVAAAVRRRLLEV